MDKQLYIDALRKKKPANLGINADIDTLIRALIESFLDAVEKIKNEF